MTPASIRNTLTQGSWRLWLTVQIQIGRSTRPSQWVVNAISSTALHVLHDWLRRPTRHNELPIPFRRNRKTRISERTASGSDKPGAELLLASTSLVFSAGAAREELPGGPGEHDVRPRGPHPRPAGPVRPAARSAHAALRQAAPPDRLQQPRPLRHGLGVSDGLPGHGQPPGLLLFARGLLEQFVPGSCSGE